MKSHPMPTTDPQKHTAENREYRYQQERNVPMDGRAPYNEFPIYATQGKFELLATCDEERKAKRIVECVNSMAGIASPAEAMETVRKALEMVANDYDGDQCAACAAALELLTPRK